MGVSVYMQSESVGRTLLLLQVVARISGEYRIANKSEGYRTKVYILMCCDFQLGFICFFIRRTQDGGPHQRDRDRHATKCVFVVLSSGSYSMRRLSGGASNKWASSAMI